MADGSEPMNVMKIRGISLDSDAERILNFESMKRLVLALVNQQDMDDFVIVKFLQIVRTKDHRVISRVTSKRYKPVFNKRRLLENFDSLPFGYVDDGTGNVAI